MNNHLVAPLKTPDPSHPFECFVPLLSGPLTIAEEGSISLVGAENVSARSSVSGSEIETREGQTILDHNARENEGPTRWLFSMFCH